MTKALFFVGPQKCGTTAVWQALKEAGAPLARSHKETFFFDRCFVPERERYLAQHHGGLDRDFIEVSPSYFSIADTPRRIQSMFPSARIVITFREPVSRAISMYRHLLRYGRISDDGIARAFAIAPEWFPAGDYISDTRRWIQTFGPDRVLILFQDARQTYPVEMFQDVADFAELPIVASARLRASDINKAQAARSRRVSRVCADVSLFLRRKGGGALVQAAKRIGLRRLIYSSDASRLHRVDATDVSFLEETLAVDRAFFQAFSGRSVRGRDVLAYCGAQTGRAKTGEVACSPSS